MPLPAELLGHVAHPADVAPGQRAGEVAIVTRSGVVESRHLGHAVLVDPDGEVVAAVGEPTTTVLPRSALKPWQAASVRRAGATHDGAPLDGPALALAAGSHSGRSRHVDLVTTLLHATGLDLDALQCPPALPADPAAHHSWIAEDRDASPVAHNCSGKHAAMLAACVTNGWPTASYLDPDHPLQQRVRADLEAATGHPVQATMVDGCGTPLYAVELRDLARAAGAFVRGDAHERAVTAAMRSHRWAVGGPGREDTLVMDALDGVLAKTGAEGVQLLATAEGWAVVVKVLDGAHRAAMPAALALLGRVPGVDVAAAAEATREVVHGRGRAVGAVLPGAAVGSA